MKSLLSGFATTPLFTTSALVQAQVVEHKSLTLEGAQKVFAAAMAEAPRLNSPGGAIAIVDDGGHPVLSARLDNTFAAGAIISLGKARTSALLRKPTKFFEDIVNKGRTTMVALPDALFTPLQGGVPIVVDGQVVGAIGVSGAASAQQDEELAMAGAREAVNKSTARAGAGIGRCSLSSCTTPYIPVAALRPHPAAARSLRFLHSLRASAAATHCPAGLSLARWRDSARIARRSVRSHHRFSQGIRADERSDRFEARVQGFHPREFVGPRACAPEAAKRTRATPALVAWCGCTGNACSGGVAGGALVARDRRCWSTKGRYEGSQQRDAKG